MVVHREDYRLVVIGCDSILSLFYFSWNIFESSALKKPQKSSFFGDLATKRGGGKAGPLRKKYFFAAFLTNNDIFYFYSQYKKDINLQ